MQIKLAKFIFPVLFGLLLSSCQTYKEQAEPAPGDDKAEIDATSSQLYSPWRESGINRSPAIVGLLDEVDRLISKKQFQKADIKLERVLRITPDYAPAWSRMAWLALQMNRPERALQMASRSNSLAGLNVPLLKLNWSFKLAASKKMHDEAGIRLATEKIHSLEQMK